MLACFFLFADLLLVSCVRARRKKASLAPSSERRSSAQQETRAKQASEARAACLPRRCRLEEEAARAQYSQQCVLLEYFTSVVGSSSAAIRQGGHSHHIFLDTRQHTFDTATVLVLVLAGCFLARRKRALLLLWLVAVRGRCWVGRASYCTVHRSLLLVIVSVRGLSERQGRTHSAP